jgi:serine O-acetyltransferase
VHDTIVNAVAFEPSKKVIMSKLFIKQLHERHKLVSSDFPDKESSDDFVDKLFGFLFNPVSARNRALNEVEKEFDSLKSYLTTLVYDVLHDGNQSQQVTEQFFKALPKPCPMCTMRS